MPAGYKVTELGVLPKEWQVAKLGKHVAFRTGPFGSALHKSDYVPGGIPIVNPMQIVAGELVPTESMAISKQAAVQLSDFLLSSGDIVIGRRGEMGRCAVVEDKNHGWLCGTGSMIIKVTKSVNARYLQRILSSPAVIAAIESTSVGTTMINLNQSVLGNLKIPLPSPDEQQAIAAALGEMDALLVAQWARLEKQRAVKQGLLQGLLSGEKRLPGFVGEWQVTTLNALATIAKGSQLHSSKMTVGGKYAHLNGGINPSGFTSEANTKGNTIAISEGGNSCGYVQFMALPFWCGGHCYAVSPKRGVENLFLYQALKGEQENIMALRVGSGLPNVQKKALLSLNLRMPVAPDEQRAIADVLSEADAHLAALEAEHVKTQLLKQGMMQNLLNGKIRLV